MLISKMKYFGFGAGAVGWIQSYLASREQVTKVGTDKSEPLRRQRGVPQGSCLGPILFNLYTSDLPSCVQNCTVHQYADDCQLHLSYEPELVSVAIDSINSDLCNIHKWSASNGLKLNVGKCTVMHIAPQEVVQVLSESGVQVILGGEKLSVCDKVKTLGVVLDNGLTLSDHVTCTIQKALGRLRGLYRFRDLLPETAKLQIIQSLILSVFYYCYPAYGFSISRKDTDRIQRMQNSAVRFVFCLQRNDHVSSFRDAANLAPMEAVCRMMICCMIHKTLQSGEPRYLCERLRYRGEVAQRSTRQDRRLHFRKVSLEVGRRAFSYFGPKLYNGLPDELISCNFSCNSFKNKLKILLL